MANSFDTKYKANIDGLAKANKVDTGTAAAMLRSNLAGTGSYKGGGVLDFGQANKDLQASYNEEKPARSNGQSGFDTNDMYDATKKAKNSLLEQNYKNYLARLQANYDDDMASLESNKATVNANYNNEVEGIQNTTYQNVEADKVVSAERGMMNSQQGMASRQNVVRAGNTAVNKATDSRNQYLNDIANQIANLTKAFGNNKQTALENYQLGLVQNENEALSQKYATDLDLFKYNTDYDRQIETEGRQNAFTEKMANLQNSFAINLSNLDFDHQSKLAQLNGDIQAKLAKMSIGASASSMQKEIDRAFNQSQAQVFMEHFSPYTGKYTGATSKAYDQAVLGLSNGSLTYDQAYDMLVTQYKKQKAGDK